MTWSVCSPRRAPAASAPPAPLLGPPHRLFSPGRLRSPGAPARAPPPATPGQPVLAHPLPVRHAVDAVQVEHEPPLGRADDFLKVRLAGARCRHGPSLNHLIGCFVKNSPIRPLAETLLRGSTAVRESGPGPNG